MTGGRAIVELAAASNFSFLRGASHPEEMVLEAAALGLDGIAICDRNSLAGVVRAHMAAKEASIGFAVGCRLVFMDGTPDIFVWPEDRKSYGHLCELLTLGKRRAPKGECHLRFADLMEKGEGLLLALVPPREIDGRLADILKTLADRFGDHVHLALSRHYGPGDQRRMKTLFALAKASNVPLVAIGDALYHTPARRPLQDVLTCIREHETLQGIGTRLEANAERHLRDPRAMRHLFRGHEAALGQAAALFGRIDFSLDELRHQYPEDPVFEELGNRRLSSQEALAGLVALGLKERYPAGPPEKVLKSIDHEMALIARLDYAPYFLTVRDIVRFARSQGILCQGRGSAANSVVCYCLGVTDVNPDKVDLLFERFISEERGEPPDIDVDFEHERREEVIQYIYGKYGRDKAGLAATVVSYRSRSALREVAKVFGYSDDAISAINGTKWGSWSVQIDEEDARRAGLDPTDRHLKQMLDLASEIIGFPRHLSQHVGG
ncbi:MAG: PHP domain-containing protein, partial [Rhodobiaceae bacterium]|nr:PHP domain-containing protein [Rhodobiaceae bacterium]